MKWILPLVALLYISAGANSSLHSAKLDFIKGKKLYSQGNYAEAQKFYKKSCSSGLSDVCNTLAFMYIDGILDSDYSTMVTVLNKGCENNNALSCLLLATTYSGLYTNENDANKVEEAKNKGCKLLKNSMSQWQADKEMEKWNCSNGASLSSDNIYKEFINSSGDKYSGTLKDNMYHGYGTYSWTTGDTYAGDWKKGIKHGQGMETYADGNKYIGSFISGNREGKGIYLWSNGNKYIGTWKNNKRHGQGTMSLSNGNKYIGNWKDGKYHGHGTYSWVSGDIYVGNWEYGKRHGQGTMKWSNGENYKGGWGNGKKHGKGVTIFRNGNKYTDSYTNGKRHGKGTYTAKKKEKTSNRHKEESREESEKKFKVINVPNTDTLKVRKDAGTQNKKIGELSHDAKDVEVLHRKKAWNDKIWCKVKHPSTVTGWVSQMYLKPYDVNTKRYKVVNVPSTITLKVRTNAGTKNRKIDDLSHDAKNVKVLKCKKASNGKKWCRVKHKSIETGWVSAEYLKVCEENEKKYKVVGIPSTNTLKVRKDAGTKNKKIGDLSYDTKDVIVENCKDALNGQKWCQVKHPSTVTGWVSALYLKAYEETTYKVIDVSSDDTLKIRRFPGTHSWKIGNLAYNAKGVVVIECKKIATERKWCKVSHPSITTGWVSAIYLELE